MDCKEHKKYQKALKKYSAKILSSKKEAQEFLIRAGIHDKNGNLNKHYTSNTK
jgi:hypothetical protein